MVISLEDAVSACDSALKTESDLMSACQTLGNVLQMMGRFSAAVQWHTWAVAPPENRTEMFARIGALYGQQQRRQEAIAAYEQAIQCHPNYAPAHWSLANLYAELGKTEAEIYHRQQAMQCNPSWATPNLQFYLGNQLMAQQRSEEAIAYYQGAVDRHPDFFEAHYNLAIALMQQQDWTAARAALKRSIELEPNYAPSYYALGQIAQQQDEWLEAHTHFDKTVHLDPESLSAWSALGETCLKLHEWDEAICAYHQAIDLGADSPWTYHNLGYALLKQQCSAAVEWLQRSIDLDPEPWFYLHLAEAWMQQHDWQAATAALLKAASLQPDLNALYLPLGRSLRHLLQVEADRAETIVAMLDPAHQQTDFYRSIAQSLANCQQYEGAVLFYRLAGVTDAEPQLQQVQNQQKQLNQRIADYYWGIDQLPQQDERYTQLAHLLADQGEVEAAIALHRKALGLKGWQTAVDREYCFTRDWFTHNIPVWMQHLQEFVDRPAVQALEVGCFEGMASCWLLDHVLTDLDSRLVCIDRYLQENFAINIDRSDAAQKVVRQLGDSHRLLPRKSRANQSASFDLIYLSGDPRADHIRQDGELSWTLLKRGGILIFDYYGWIHQEPIADRSSRGIDAFLVSVQSGAQVLHQGYQMIVRKVED